MHEKIQGLWIGDELSAMERLSIRSFLANGHPYSLYVYDAVGNVPDGVLIEDASRIVPPSRIFQYSHSKSYAGFANYFRYKLLLETGGWWADTDVVCLRPFDFKDEYVFATEPTESAPMVNNGIIKVPAGSGIMAHACKVCESKDPAKLAWGETGPRLLDAAVAAFGLNSFVKEHQAFCPIKYSDWERVLEPEFVLPTSQGLYAVHLWNEMWRRAGRDKNGAYHSGCIYEQMKRRYLSQ